MRIWIPLVIAIAGCSTADLDPKLVERDGGESVTRDAGDRDSGENRDAGDALTDGGVMADGGVGADGSVGADGGITTPITLGGARPAPMHIPSDYDGAALPLVVLLHGYSVTGEIQDLYFGLSARVDEDRFFAIVPTGTTESMGQRTTFWNATPACCNFYGSQVDDVAYLDGLVTEAQTVVNVDPKRIYFVGHSNGGFMSYRMACEAQTEIAAIVSLAGATFFDPNNCVDPEPIHVLQIHGTSDTTIAYAGVMSGPTRYPGAIESVTRWAGRAGCDTTTFDEGTNRDIDSVLLGDEATVRTYRTGCQSGLEHELWTLPLGTHIPTLQPDFAEQILTWMADHPRP